MEVDAVYVRENGAEIFLYELSWREGIGSGIYLYDEPLYAIAEVPNVPVPIRSAVILEHIQEFVQEIDLLAIRVCVLDFSSLFR